MKKEDWKKLKYAETSSDIEESRKIYEELLSHPFQHFRIASAEALGNIKSAKSIYPLSFSLNDRCPYVYEESALALAKINTKKSLEILKQAFFEDELDRPHHLANAISLFGNDGFNILKNALESNSATLRYYAARGLGSTGQEKARDLLENLLNDQEKTKFGGSVATAAKKGLKTLDRIKNKS